MSICPPENGHFARPKMVNQASKTLSKILPKPCRKSSKNLAASGAKTVEKQRYFWFLAPKTLSKILPKPCRKSSQNLVENPPKTLSKIEEKICSRPPLFLHRKRRLPRSCWRISRPPAPARAAGGSGRPFLGPPKNDHCSYSVLQEVGPRHPALKFGIALSACSFFLQKVGHRRAGGGWAGVLALIVTPRNNSNASISGFAH